MKKRIMWAFLVAELLVAFGVAFVSSVVMLGEHSTETGRLVNFCASLIGAAFLFVFGCITAAGKGTSSCRGESTAADWFLQEFYVHGDRYISGMVALVAIANYAVDEVQPYMMMVQAVASMMLSLNILFLVIVSLKLKPGHKIDMSARFDMSPEARLLVEQPWSE